MPVVEIRDSIEGTVTTDGGGFGYMTRRINLREGHKFSMQSIDIFNDNGIMPLAVDPLDARNAAYQLYVSPFPMQQVGGEWGYSAPRNAFPGGGQAAGEPNVLYKEISVIRGGDDTQQINNSLVHYRFPNDCVAATPTFTWFSPHVYVTVMVWNAPEVDINIKFTCYMKLKQTKANPSSSAMGMYSEFLDSQIKKLTDTAVVYAPDVLPGNTFPTWKFGGIRPELMLSGTTALRYFNRLAANASQDMVEQNELLTAFRSATNMVEFDEGFGDAVNNLPEWITLMNVAGVTSGPIRPYPPPLKYADNGNTLMF
tara:strand:- start:339 stop:1274 length:936 start_codon:yes stop_codon:yes gene_type:complete